MNIVVTNRFSLVGLIKEKYQYIVFAMYLLLLGTTVAHHEPWMDEAQAWLLAKDLGLKELLVKYLRYEGSPGLWHLILMIPAKLDWPYSTINIISALFSATGVWLFIRYSPFPAIIKILFPFSFFIFFQYGVVARSYSLITPILFSIALLYKHKEQRPYLFVALLGLLANISAHTFLIAGSIAFIHFLDVIKLWPVLDKKSRIRQMTALSLFGLIALVVIYIILTPSDQIFANHSNWEFENFCKTTERMISGSLIVSEFNHIPYLYGYATIAIFLTTIWWFDKNRLLLVFLLPLALLCTLFAIKYRNYWHQGVLFLLWIFVLWLSFEKYGKQQIVRSYKMMVGTIAVVLAVQVYWSIDAISYDLKYNYSGSYSLAKYIKEKGLEKEKIYVSGWRNISVLPYFDKNIFYNHNGGSNHRFWNWSKYNVTSLGAGIQVIDTLQCEQPGVIIFASDHIPSQQKIYIPGYKAVAFFKGYLCWKTGLLEPECYLVFRKTETQKEKIVYQPKYSIDKTTGTKTSTKAERQEN